MEYRRTKSIGLIKCPCGNEVKKGEYAFVPVFLKNDRLNFGRALCRNCKNKGDQDGSFQPDPVARKGGLVSMDIQRVNKDFWCNTGEERKASDGNTEAKEVRSL